MSKIIYLIYLGRNGKGDPLAALTCKMRQPLVPKQELLLLSPNVHLDVFEQAAIPKWLTTNSSFNKLAAPKDIFLLIAQAWSARNFSGLAVVKVCQLPYISLPSPSSVQSAATCRKRVRLLHPLLPALTVSQRHVSGLPLMNCFQGWTWKRPLCVSSDPLCRCMWLVHKALHAPTLAQPRDSLMLMQRPCPLRSSLAKRRQGPDDCWADQLWEIHLGLTLRHTLWIWASVSQASPWIVFRPSEHLEGETLSLLGRFLPCGVRPKDSAGHYLLEPFPGAALRGPGFPILQWRQCRLWMASRLRAHCQNRRLVGTSRMWWRWRHPSMKREPRAPLPLHGHRAVHEGHHAMCQVHVLLDCRHFDAAQAVRVPQLPFAGAERQQVPGKLEGMADMMAHAKLPQPKAEALAAEILALGALDINELTVGDWKNLAAFQNLLPLEQRRLLSFLLPGWATIQCANAWTQLNVHFTLMIFLLHVQRAKNLCDSSSPLFGPCRTPQLVP